MKKDGLYLDLTPDVNALYVTVCIYVTYHLQYKLPTFKLALLISRVLF